MGSLSAEEYRYIDAFEDQATISDSKSDDWFDVLDPVSCLDNAASSGPDYDMWIRSPESVKERRAKFLNWMGIELDRNSIGELVGVHNLDGERDMTRESIGQVIRNPGFEDGFCSTRLTVSYLSADATRSLEEVCSVENLKCSDARLSECSGMRSENSATSVESKNVSASSPLSRQHNEKDVDESNNFPGSARKSRKSWLSRLQFMTCFVEKQCEAEKQRHDDDDDVLLHYQLQRTKVHQCGKSVKELSALYKSQEIRAHKGSILTMKFSADSQYLASGGKDGVVRVWQVLNDDRSKELDIPEIDPSSMYFTLSHLSALKPLFVDKEKTAVLGSLRRTSDSACVIFPPNIFQLLEKPLHEFHGHNGEVLDLSWSKNHHLLSASDDKTVRLWRIGCNSCLRVFSHGNYVTSVHFNPTDDNYFMSGSIDGKVRIWAVPTFQVIDWTEVKDIVTAVCYHPDGQGAITGSMSGNCRFYSMSDGHLQLDTELCLHSKKSSPCKRITGFQFCPEDSSKVMVTCASSQIRILQGLDMIGKFKGQRSTSNQMSACFTSDGKHIISACEDSNVYLWNCTDGQKDLVSLETKSVKSYERFSTNASIAIPWCGMKSGYSSDDNSRQVLLCSLPSRFSLSEEYLLESLPKGSFATWPEEKLMMRNSLSTASSVMHKSQYKFLRASCQNTFTSHAWGLVIVTGSHDGLIRSFHNYGLPASV